ncbi:hypothetical protein [Haloechinothrix halophila]|uniref:hypothetical protein n=1 Tax=Haloechinothrix halophila TaxID=1069073 RepID=UPI000413372F|nr:hypothetical protein [Haloechinothrix halophila]
MKQDGDSHDRMPDVIVEPGGTFDPDAEPAEYPHADRAPRRSPQGPTAPVTGSLCRLVTRVELCGRARRDRVSCSAHLRVESTDGQAIPLLDDRGWSSSGPADIWAYQTVEDIESTARMVVGPDEPRPGETYDEADAEHWGALADTVRGYGVEIDPAELAALPHDVELSSSVLAQLRLGEAGGT